MPHSDSEGETIDDLEEDTRTTDADGDEDNDLDEDLLALENGIADDATEADEDSPSEDSEDDDDDDEEDSDPAAEPTMDVEASSPLVHAPNTSKPISSPRASSQEPTKAPVIPKVRARSPSPARARKRTLLFKPNVYPRSFTVEAVCAIPHPAPIHALASSLCMTHLITGSDDGYIRDYDVYAAVNGKITLSAPQRHHCNVVEGNMKAGQIRFWWENPDLIAQHPAHLAMGERILSPVYSLAMHSDAIWALAGTKRGHINLFTVRHDPGRLVHVFANGHRGAVSSVALDHDEKGFFSAGWDGEAFQWDLNTGQTVRKFTAHGAQLVSVAVRPLTSPYDPSSPVSSAAGVVGAYHAAGDAQYTTHHARDTNNTAGVNAETLSSTADGTGPQPSSAVSAGQNTISNQQTQQTQDSDARSDASFDPLFDDEPDADGEPDNDGSLPDGGAVSSQTPQQPVSIANAQSNIAGQEAAASYSSQQSSLTSRTSQGSVAPPKGAPPLFDAATCASFSSDILMIAAIDGQVMLWDKRVNTPGHGVGRLWMSEKTPPWCVSACWSTDGSQIYAGRRNGTVDVWDVRQLGRSGIGNAPRLLKSLRNPASSGVVSCVVPFPDGRHIACASTDNIRLWNAAEAGEVDGSAKSRGAVQFKIIPGHHGGYVSQMLVDPGGCFLVSASSNRGWHGESTRTVFVHDIKAIG
ncbi:WD40 repeat-like protein [Hygrophoropsis aurantiaca]|uniref:WD40 repeat-like protein n=1 Tax=Hygrophoropsis aurantiaca TaxID=72124 RepID=A0ACB8AJK3_9AGAM|nr:WD40 repeat-like protein [Hygrophoropsis aurantiaca]